MRNAIIDVGSNSVILTIEDWDGSRWRPYLELTEVTALGENVKLTGRLSPEAIERTSAALKRFTERARAEGSPVRAFATMSARLASNTWKLVERASQFGLKLDVLSADDEARYGFLAVVTDPKFSCLDRISIVDPGGQSTELVTATRNGSGWNTDFRRSYAVGTLGLKESLFPDERLTPSQLLSSIPAIDDLIGLCYLPREAGAAVVLGASGTNLISIRDRLATWQPDLVHGARLDYEEVSKAVSWLGRMSDQERAAVVGMERGREKTIHLGALILERFLFALRVVEAFVSIRGWRHGILEQE